MLTGSACVADSDATMIWQISGSIGQCLASWPDEGNTGGDKTDIYHLQLIVNKTFSFRTVNIDTGLLRLFQLSILIINKTFRTFNIDTGLLRLFQLSILIVDC